MIQEPLTNISRVPAVHPLWKGFLLMEDSSAVVVHEAHKSRGTYIVDKNILKIDWDEFPPEEFLLIDGIYTYVTLVSQARVRPVVNSFDIFDTLLARRCVTPDEIFHKVESRSRFDGFAELRKRAEADLFRAGEYKFADIYQTLQDTYGIEGETAAALKKLEIEEEFDNLIPIAQHVAEVRPGDLLVSDMYLPAEFIARVLSRKCNLFFNQLYLSSHGKRYGKAWDDLAAPFNILLHTGDNAVTDIENCRQRGIPTRLTSVAMMTERERRLESGGFTGLARAVREARLALWDADEALLALELAQIEVNFPLLFLFAAWTYSLVERRGYTRVLFSSRDCHLLQLVFSEISARLGGAARAEYFATSRIARAAPSPSYLNYLEHLSAGQNTLIVDLCGTGWSLSRLVECANRHDIDIVLMHHMLRPDVINHYRSLAPLSRIVDPIFITEEGDNTILEALNTAAHPMVIDIVQAGDAFFPRYFGQFDPSDPMSRHIHASEQAICAALRCAEHIEAAELRRYVDVVTPHDIKACYDEFRSVADAVQGIRSLQLSENVNLEEIPRRLDPGSSG